MAPLIKQQSAACHTVSNILPNYVNYWIQHCVDVSVISNKAVKTERGRKEDTNKSVSHLILLSVGPIWHLTGLTFQKVTGSTPSVLSQFKLQQMKGEGNGKTPRWSTIKVIDSVCPCRPFLGQMYNLERRIRDGLSLFHTVCIILIFRLVLSIVRAINQSCVMRMMKSFEFGRLGNVFF